MARSYIFVSFSMALKLQHHQYTFFIHRNLLKNTLTVKYRSRRFVLSKSRGSRSLTHASLGVDVLRGRLAHDIEGALYWCSGLASHTVGEELNASYRGARGA